MSRRLRQGPRTAPPRPRPPTRNSTQAAHDRRERRPAPTTASATTAERKSVTFNEHVEMAAAAPPLQAPLGAALAAPHPAFSQQPAAAPGAFTLPANVPRPRPRCVLPSTDWRNGSASDTKVTRSNRVSVTHQCDGVAADGTPTGELPPALGGGAARRPGAALRPLASRRSPMEIQPRESAHIPL